jgi:iron complex transport system substrate-binding protein
MVSMSRRLVAVARALAGIAAVIGCTGLPRAAIVMQDDAGYRLGLARPAQRIVSLTPHLTELLFEAGAGTRVVGTVAHSDYPQAARSLVRIGDARAIDIERILALRPDLVVAWRSGSPLRQVSRLRELGLPVFLDEPGHLDAIAVTIERLGLLAGTSATAAQSAQRFRDRLAGIRHEYAHRREIRVFYQIWDRPLLTVSAQHVIGDALRSCGARNIFAQQRLLVPRPEREAVLLADPEAIVAADGSGAQQARLQGWLVWRSLQAVRLGNLYTLDPDLMHRHSPRILEGVEALCRHIDTARAKLAAAS